MTLRGLLAAISASNMDEDAKRVAWRLVVVGSLHTGDTREQLAALGVGIERPGLDKPTPQT